MNSSVCSPQKYHLDSNLKRVLSKPLFWVLFVTLSFSYPIYRSLNRVLPPPPPVFHTIPPFELVDAKGKIFTHESLRGKVYLANFAFTTCPTICPSLMKSFEDIQRRIKGVGDAVQLVTFTVDPAFDTPPVLDRYAQTYNANPHLWKFLTGNPSDIEALLIQGFKVPMGQKESVEKTIGTEPVTVWDIAHSGKLVLVDQLGQVRGYFDHDKISVDQVMITVGLLINGL